MPRVGFEPTIPGFERAKTVHALEREANVIGCITFRRAYFFKIKKTVRKVCQFTQN
jgi:hypothetical protein